MKTPTSTRWHISLLKAILAFTGITALLAGPQLIWDPTGRLLGLSTELLKDSPFTDFLIPGVLLTLFIGLHSLLVFCWLAWPRLFAGLELLNPAPRYSLRWLSVLVAGLALVIWITVQVVMVGFTMLLQLFYFVLGLVVLFLAFLPGVGYALGVKQPGATRSSGSRREATDFA